MSGSNPENSKEHEHAEDEGSAVSPQEEEEALKKKYGGKLPKKPPLIAKDHERAFFDSADWALGKEGAPTDQKPPKLQPTPQQQVKSRRSVYAPNEDGEDGGGNGSEDQSPN